VTCTQALWLALRRSGATVAVAGVAETGAAGTGTVKAWLGKDGTPKPSIDMVAHALLTAYHVTRKRKAQADAQQAQQRQREPLDAYTERDGLGDW